MKKMENEIKRYERLCEEAGITTVTMNFFVKPEQLFKFFRVVVKDCQNEKKVVEDSTMPEELDNKELTIRAIHKYNKYGGLNTRKLSELCGYAMRTAQQWTKKLSDEGVIIKEGDNWFLK